MHSRLALPEETHLSWFDWNVRLLGRLTLETRVCSDARWWLANRGVVQTVADFLHDAPDEAIRPATLHT